MAILEKDLREIIVKALDAWSETDPEDFVLGYTESILAIDPRIPTPIRGRKELVEWFKKFKVDFGKFTIKMIHFEMLAANSFYYEFVMTYGRAGEERKHMIFRPVILLEEGPGFSDAMLVRFEQWDMYPSDAQGNRLG